MHELNHAHWAIVHDDGMPVAKVGEDVPDWRGTKLKPAERDTVEAAVEHERCVLTARPARGRSRS